MSQGSGGAGEVRISAEADAGVALVCVRQVGLTVAPRAARDLLGLLMRIRWGRRVVARQTLWQDD
ncbi:MAG: hypothetical protein CMH38_16660 [Microbacterium sp.]|nr:hypothetical protein [Microbacterium sp.]HAS33169.1 hypothetical protein [Microbacterium sp.]